MATQVRTLTFLPEIFQTEINSQFLGSTLDILVNSPDLKRVNGLIGQKHGYGVSGNEKYVVEPTEERSNYQLEPSVVFLKEDTSVAQDFIDYPGIINELAHQGGATQNHNRLFSNEFYTWDSFTNLDKSVNYSMYYWLPLGPDAIIVADSVDLTLIEGETNYTTPAGLEFINGLKVVFSQPTQQSRTNIEYYVEGVGTAIRLVPVDELLCTEITGGGIYTPFDKNNFDTDVWSIKLYIPIQPDYITMNRASSDRNQWSRSNRWFHQRVLDTTEEWNGQITKNPSNTITRAQRPIIEFEADLRLFNSGTKSAGVVDYIDTYTTNAETSISGALLGTATVAVTLGTTASVVGGKYQLDTVDNLVIDQEIVFKETPGIGSSYVTGVDSKGKDIYTNYAILGNAKLNKKYYVKTIDRDLKQITVTDFSGTVYPKTIVSSTSVAETIPSMTLTSVATVQSSAKVIFAADNNPAVRKKVYNIYYTGTEATAVAVMSEVGTVAIEDNVQVHVSDGPGNLNGTSWRFMTNTWIRNQHKEAINQAPLFDIFDTNENSFGDTDYYPGSTFAGTKIMGYQPGVGTNDSVLGFPLAYSTGSGGADYLFDITLNTDKFTYKSSGTKIQKKVSDGFVQKLTDYTQATYRTGWVKAAAPSKQYQLFNFTADVTSTAIGFTCDILANTREQVTWSPVVVYLNGSFIQPKNIAVTRDTTLHTTTVKLIDTLIATGDSVSVSILSDEVSNTAHYSIPDNLQNNPFNYSLDSIALGEVKQHYLTIFNNAPGTDGDQLGSNNYGDLGDITKYGNRIVHSSASLVLPGVFLRKSQFNLQDSLRYSAEKYQDYKEMLSSLALESDYSVYQTPSQILDDVIARLTGNKVPTDSFFWTDMLPNGGAYATNSYEYRTGSVNTVIPLSRVYDHQNANYNCVYVYYEKTTNSKINSELLLNHTDYVISDTQPIITMIREIEAGARIVVKEYNQTYGSYCPSTPTKLGLFPATTPRIYTDNSYQYPQTFIVGHDGSYTRLYGRYTNEQFTDFRDLVLFEFEKRVYNNIKVSGTIPLREDDIISGQWRKTPYEYDEVQTLYNTKFLDWAGKYRIDYRRQHYESANKFSYNYSKSGNKLDGTVLKQGGWRGLYYWFYDTVNPAQTPWEMLGLTDKPLWWDERYGSAPYTAGNSVLWQDIAEGIVWNNGEPFVVESRKRPGLLSVLPVDAAGKLLPPILSVVGNYDNNTFKRGWRAGDGSEAEAAYLKSSTWPFDLMGLLSVFEPAKFYNYFADRDAYKYSETLDQFVFNERYHLNAKELVVYGTDATTAKHSYMNWVVDYAGRSGASGADQLSTVLKNLDVRLTYRLAGFSDKEYLKFFTENSTPSATSANLLIPDDSFDLMLYDNIPASRIKYSSVIVQKTSDGYTVWGNDLITPHFSITTPLEGPTETITKSKSSVNVSKLYDSVNLTKIAYGTLYFTTTGVAEFLLNYGRALEQAGVTFEQVKNGITLNWRYMVTEFLDWAQQSWEVGSTINLNPAATKFTAYKEGLVVQPLTIAQENFVLNQNLFPIPTTNIAVNRNNQGFGITVLSDEDTVAYTNLNMSAIEHAIVFNNETLFGDVIYNNKTGMRQARIIMNGSLTAEWNGGVTASGFILNEGNVDEWNSSAKYPKGQIVKYKNLYWSATQLVEPTGEFDYTKWKQSSYDSIKQGLLPNPNTGALQSTNLYDIHSANLDSESDLLAFGLIGYKPRTYMSESQLSDISQINVYRNMIRSKGTMLGANSLKGATMTQGTLDYTVHENWAIKRGEFGGVLNSNYIEALLDGGLISGNPGIIGFGDGTSAVDGAHQTITINPYSLKGSAGYVNDLINYGRAPKSNEFLPPSDIPTSQQRGLPSAGYVNIDDVKYAAFTLDDLNLNKEAVTDTYRDDIVWLANHRGEWDVFTPATIQTNLTLVTNNFDGTVTMKFSSSHGLKQYDILYVVQFDDRINGFYSVGASISSNEILVSLSLDKTATTVKGTGVCFKMMSRRVTDTTILDDYSEVVKYGQFSTHRSWIDQSTTGEWQVLTNGPVYKKTDITTPAVPGYGTAVAYSSDVGYIVADGNGNIYQNGVKIANKKGGTGSGTALVANGKYVYCSSPSEGLMYTYDFSGEEFSASIIKKGAYYTVGKNGTTDFKKVGATPLWTGVKAQFTPETDTVVACMIVFDANGHAVFSDKYATYISSENGTSVTSGTYVVEQTHTKVDGIKAFPNDVQNTKLSLAKSGQQSIALTAVAGIKVGDWVVSKYFPLGTKVQSINTNNKAVTFNARLTVDVLDTRTVLTPATDTVPAEYDNNTGDSFTFYRPVSETTLPDDLNKIGIYRVSESVPLTVAMSTTVSPDDRTKDIQLFAQPIPGTPFLATADGSGIISNTGAATDYLGGTGWGKVVDGKFVPVANGSTRYNAGTGTVKREYSSFDIGTTTGQFAISADRTWLYVANSASREIDVYIYEIDSYKLVDTITGNIGATGFGSSIATVRDGSKLIVGAPNETVDGSNNAGAVYIYARSTENFLQSNTAVKVVPDQTYAITDMGGVDGENKNQVGATTLSQWFMMGAGIRFRAHITEDAAVWKEGNIMTVGDSVYGIHDVKGKNDSLRILIGSYISGHDSVHSVGLYTNDVKTDTQITAQFDSHETATATPLCTGDKNTNKITIKATKTTGLNISVGQLVRMNKLDPTVAIATYNADATMSYIPQDTYVDYISGNADYSNVATWAAGTYTRNQLVVYSGYIYKCIASTTTNNPSNTTDWSLQYVTVGLTNSLVGNITELAVSFRPAGLRGRYVVSKSHDFGGSTLHGFNGSYVLAVKPGVEFKALGYGSYVAPLKADGTPQYDSNNKLLVINKSGYVTLRKSFVVNDVIPGAKAAIYVDNKLIPSYVTAQRNGATYNSYNYKITVDTIKNQSTVTFVKTPPLGSVVVVDYGQLKLQQRTQSASPRIGALYGRSVATNNWGAEIFVGSPYESTRVETKNNVEGAVYRWTNGGQRYNTVKLDLSGIPADGSGKYDFDATIYIDGFLIELNATNELSLDNLAQRISTVIDTTEPTNVASSVIKQTTINGKSIGPFVVISNSIPGTLNDQVDITTEDIDTISVSTNTSINLVPYTNTQKLYEYDLSSTGAFGYTVAVNQELNTTRDSLVVSAPFVTSVSETTFDFLDDLRDDDTIFDNGGTTFIDKIIDGGAVYQYDYLASATNTLSNPGIYVYGQYVNLNESEGRAVNPKYGQVLAFNEGKIFVGSPGWYLNGNGRATAFQNTTYLSSWHVDKEPPQKVDVRRLRSISIYDTTDGNIIENIDYIDPAQGKMLSVIEANIDHISSVDPANYTSGIVWAADQVGRVWLDTTNLRLMNYNQPDAKYNSRYFGQAFPGSTVALFTWIESSVAPVDYNGSGYPIDLNAYTTTTLYDRQADKLVTRYFFWVKNYGLVPPGKTLAPSTLTRYILNPLDSGLPFLGALSTTTVGLFNCTDLIREKTSALHLGYSESKSTDYSHSDWLLIKSDDDNSFLPGVPTALADAPSSLYLKYLTSFMGKEIETVTQEIRPTLDVPDQNLSVLARYGVQFRPRQTMFEDRELALKNIVQYANTVLAKIPAVEVCGTFFLGKNNTANYWKLTDWWAPGYSSKIKASVEVDTYNSLSIIGNSDVINAGATGVVATLSEGLVARVKKNGQGLYETYEYTSTAGWTRINVENGTITLLDTLYTETPAPAQEIYWILRWIHEQVFVGDYAIERNNSLMMMFNFIQSNSPQQQNYLPWLNKTSFIDIEHTIRQLLPYKKYQIQSSTLINGFINEVKPFHVFIKEFSYKYNAIEYFDGTITDFDLPSKFRSSNSKFVSPILKGSNATQSSGEYLSTNDIWQESEYSDWFSNYGLSLTNYGNTVVEVTKLTKQPQSNDEYFYFESVAALPVAGSVYVGTELISYTTVDRLLNRIGGLTKTTGERHYVDEAVSLVTTPVMVMDRGRGYSSAPTVTAHIDTATYPNSPRREASFLVTMKDDGVTAVTVVDSGSGYPQTPELRVSPSDVELSFTSSQVDSVISEIVSAGHQFVTGESVMWVTDSTEDTGLRNYGVYYVSALNGNSIALYENYRDAVEGFTGEQPLITGAIDKANPNTPVAPSTDATYSYFHIQSPYESDTPVFTTGDRVRVQFNLQDKNNIISFGSAFQYYYIRIDEAADKWSTKTDNVFDYVSLHETKDGALNGTTAVSFTLTGPINNLQGNTYIQLSKVARTDNSRVVIKKAVDATVSVVARLQSFYSNDVVRGIKTGIKFDRVTYKSAVIDWEEGTNRFQENGWDVTTWNSGVIYKVDDMVVYNNTLYRCVKDTLPDWEVIVNSSTTNQWAKGQTYAKGALVLYNTLVYKALRETNSRPTDFSIETFTLANWVEVDSADPLLTAADRVVGFYRPSVGMPGYTFSDLSQLMTGTKYPYQTIVNPEFDWGTTYAFVPRNVNTTDNTITLNYVKPTMAAYQEIVYGSDSAGDRLFTSYTPAVTQTAQIGNNLSLTVVDNYSLFRGQPISFLGNMIANTYTVVASDYNKSNPKKISDVIKVSEDTANITESMIGSTIKTEMVASDRVYYVADINKTASTITVAYTSNLAQITTGAVTTQVKQIGNNGRDIIIGQSLGAEWIGATVTFTSNPLVKVNPSTYFIASANGSSTITLSETITKALSANSNNTVQFANTGNAIPASATGNMGIVISPTVPMANASGFTTISFVNRANANTVIVDDASLAPIVKIDNTTELYDNAAIKFGGPNVAGLNTDLIYFVDGVNSDRANNKLAFKQYPDSPVPDDSLRASLTGTSVSLSVMMNMPYAKVASIANGNVTLSTLPVIKTGSGNLTISNYSNRAGVHFTETVSGGITATNQYYLGNANTTAKTFTALNSSDNAVTSTDASPSANLWAVFNPYLTPVETSFTTGEQVKLYVEDPNKEITNFYYVDRQANTIISLHETTSDAKIGANAIALSDARGVYGYIGKPQTIMQTAGPIAGVAGDIIPMTYEHTNPSLGFGLVNTKTYWAKFLSTSTVVLYKTYTDAVNDKNRIPLLKQTGGQFVVGKPVTVDVPQPDGSTKIEIVEYNHYDSIIVSDNDVEANNIVTGSTFDYGYGPEELMPGVVLDGVNFTVTTRPGATWDPLGEVTGVNSGSAISSKYGHTGFNMVRFSGAISDAIYSNQLVLQNGLRFDNSISFDGRVADPAVVEVYGGTSQTQRVKWAEGKDYEVDWINKVITILYDATDPVKVANVTNARKSDVGIEVVVYEFGNGNQLVRGTSDRYPLRTVALPSTHSEILLDVPYEHVEIPSKDNFWLSVTVFVNGKKIEYYDGARPLYSSTDKMFSIVPQRPYDPISDPYNPAKIVFTGEYDSTTDFASFAIVSNVLGMYQVLNVADTYQVPITDNAVSYFPGKVGVWVNGVRKTLNTHYTLTPKLPNGGGSHQLITVKFKSGVVELHDSVKITYGNDGLSIPTTEYDVTNVTPTGFVGGYQYALTNFLGDNNYAPFSDLRVIYDKTATVNQNTWQARSTVDLYNGMAIIVSGVDSNGIIPSYPIPESGDSLARIYYLRDVVYQNDNTLYKDKDTFGLYTFRLSNTPGGAVVPTSINPVTQNGQPSGLTFTVNDNLIVEVNGIRYNGTAPDILSYGGPAKPLNNNLSLVYPVPVYSLTTYDSDFVVVTVNGVTYTAADNYEGQDADPITGGTRIIKWATNYDPITKQFAGMDSLLPAGYIVQNDPVTGFPAPNPNDGFFDSGDGFDNNNIVNVVFSYDPAGIDGLTSNDVVSIQYVVTGPNWDIAVTYDAGDIVTYDGVIYRSLVDANLGNDPTDPNDAGWGEISMSPPPVYVVNVTQDTIQQVSEWSSTTPYAVNAQVYWNGAVYNAISDSKDVEPGSSTATLTWEVEPNWTPQGGWTSGTTNESVIGGTMSLYLPWVNTTTDVVNVTSFGRTSQQSLKTQILTDIIVTKITNVTESVSIATQVEAVGHGLAAGDRVFISGNQYQNLDGGQYYVDVIDADKVSLYKDEALTVPVLSGANVAFRSKVDKNSGITSSQNSYIQLAKAHAAAPGLPINPAVIDQYDYNLTNKERLYVSFTNDPNKSNDNIRYYVARENFDIVQTDYVDTDGNLKTVNTLVLLLPVIGTNAITVTSMVPTAAPAETRIRLNATWDNNGKPRLPFEYQNDASKAVYFETIYREPIASRTYVSEVYEDDTTTFKVADPFALVSLTTFTDVAIQFDSETGAIYAVLGGVDTGEISQINVFDTNGNQADGYYWIASGSRYTAKIVFEFNPSVITSSSPLVYDNKITVVVASGNKMIVRGEQMTFTGIELSALSSNYGKITGIRHATNVTNAATIAQYDSVQGILSTNLLASDQYTKDWYSNRVQTAVVSQTSASVTLNGALSSDLSQVQIGDSINFAQSSDKFEGQSYLYTGSMAVESAYTNNGTYMEFSTSSFSEVVYFVRPKPGLTTAKEMNSDGALTTTTVDKDRVNKRGYNVIVINDATGMKVDDTVNCSAIPYAIQEGTTIKYIQDIDSSKVSASKMVVLSTNLMKDLPGGTGIQASIDQPTLAPNSKLAAVGEKIQLKTSGGRVIEYLSPVTNKTIDMFTIVASYESPSNPQKWILKIAETLTTTDIDNLKRACVAVSKFDITAINKGSAWKFGTVYAVGARVTDTNGVCWSATLAHTAGIDNAPGNPEYWTAGNYTMTIAATPDCQPTAWAEYVKKYDGTSASTPAERVSYPNVGDGTLVSIVNKSMNVPLHLDTGTVATFLNYSLK